MLYLENKFVVNNCFILMSVQWYARLYEHMDTALQAMDDSITTVWELFILQQILNFRYFFL